MKDTLQVIEDIEEFKYSVRNHVFKTFLLSFITNEFFLNHYEESLLTEQMVDYWVNQFVKKECGHYAIYDSKLIKLEKELYKDFVEAIMGKLVDSGLMNMCWESETEQIVWMKNNID